MNSGSPGPRYVVSFLKSDQTVEPRRLGSVRSRHSKTDQPAGSTGIPRCLRYHSASVFRSRTRKKTPPRPVTFAVLDLVGAGLGGAGLVCRLEGLAASAARDRVGVTEREAAAHQCIHEVDLRAFEIHRAHRVDDDANAVLLDDRVVLFGTVGEGHPVREARASTRRDVHAKREVLSVLLRENLA